MSWFFRIMLIKSEYFEQIHSTTRKSYATALWNFAMPLSNDGADTRRCWLNSYSNFRRIEGGENVKSKSIDLASYDYYCRRVLLCVTKRRSLYCLTHSCRRHRFLKVSPGRRHRSASCPLRWTARRRYGRAERWRGTWTDSPPSPWTGHFRNHRAAATWGRTRNTVNDKRAAIVQSETNYIKMTHKISDMQYFREKII